MTVECSLAKGKITNEHLIHKFKSVQRSNSFQCLIVFSVLGHGIILGIFLFLDLANDKSDLLCHTQTANRIRILATIFIQSSQINNQPSADLHGRLITSRKPGRTTGRKKFQANGFIIKNSTILN